eukprot:m.205035 g.205035  ORF g.205035 m.205035 type:complete len:447 (+) comp39654_c0_seq58:2559-3899(+)
MDANSRLIYLYLFSLALFPLSCRSSNVKVIDNQIVKLRDSKESGALFLGRIQVENRDGCWQSCQDKLGCDTAIYHKAVHDKINCFFMKCDRPSLCVFSRHPDYTLLEKIDEQTTQEPAVDCVVSSWSVFSPCSVSCGNGTVVYYRMVDTLPENGGKECPSGLRKTESCQKSSCPVDCVLSEWTSFSQCSASCGTAFHFRNRTVLKEAAFGGNCPSLDEVQICTWKPCPDIDSDADAKDEFKEFVSEFSSSLPGIPIPTSSVESPSLPTPLSDDLIWDRILRPDSHIPGDLLVDSDGATSHKVNVASHDDILESTEFNLHDTLPTVKPTNKTEVHHQSTTDKSPVSSEAVTIQTFVNSTHPVKSNGSSVGNAVGIVSVATSGDMGLAESGSGRDVGGGLISLLVISLSVGILLVLAAVVMMARNWYGGVRWRRRHARMDYLINDVYD